MAWAHVLLVHIFVVLLVDAKYSSPNELRRETGLVVDAAKAREELNSFRQKLLSILITFRSGHMHGQAFQRSDYDIFGVTVGCPEGRPMVKYGGRIDPGNGFEDGHKYLCDVSTAENKAATTDCIIFSLGSNGDYSFEMEMLKVCVVGVLVGRMSTVSCLPPPCKAFISSSSSDP